MRIGLIADTHMPASLPSLWEEIAQVFAGVDLIIHAGDIQMTTVLDELEAIAPTIAALGNNDYGMVDPRVAPVQWLEIEGWTLAAVHDTEPEDEPIEHIRTYFLGGRHADVIVTGHTHVERIDHRDGVLQVNPGSAVHPRLWSTRPGTVGILEITADGIRAEVVRLTETDPEVRNPGVALRYDSNS